MCDIMMNIYKNRGVSVNFILLVIGLVLLIKCADIFVDGCSNVARFFWHT